MAEKKIFDLGANLHQFSFDLKQITENTYDGLLNTNVTYHNNAPSWDTSVIDDLKKQVERLQAQQVKEAFIKKEPQKVQCEDILDSKRSIKLSDE